jgi:gliding motility-associated-like protein
MVAGVSPCDTFVLCIGDTTDLNISFLSPKASDSTHAGLLPPVLSGVSILSNTPGNTVNMTLQLVGNAGNYGIHDVTVYGYDNESPPDTTFVTFVLEVDSTASGAIVASKDTICVGDNSKLKAVTNGKSYLWSTGQTTDSIWVKPAVTTTYTLQVFKGKCPLVLEKTIVVLNGGAITASKDSVCLGDSATLTVNNATSYIWSNGATTSTIKVKVDSTTIYKVLAKSACKTDTLSLKVTVIPVNITLSGNDSICVGNNTTITASGGTSYLWSNGATTSSITVSPATKTTYTVTVTNHGCTKDSTVTVVPSPKPTAGITVIPASDTICTGDSAMLIGSGGGNYVWPASGQVTDTIWVKPGTTTTYFLEVTKGGCTATTSKQIVVVSSPVASISLSQDSICPTDSATITATGGTSYKWLPPLSSTSSTVTVKSTTTTTYSVVVYRSCGNDTLSKTLHIQPPPKIIISHDTTICAGNGVTITASGGTTYSWSNGATTSTISVTPASTKTYTLVATNGKCSKDTTVTVTVKTPPTLSISPNQKVCSGTATTLTATATGATSYLWSNGATTSSITVTPTSNTTYVVTASNGCLTKDSATISVITPSLFACCDTTIIAGDTVSITANGSVNYVWSPDPSSLSCYTCPNPVASPTVTTTYTVTSTDSAGCKDSKEVTVYVECVDFTVPNVFTPNNDGKNDDFVPFYTIGGVNYNGVGNVSSYTITIYDRWGKQVYNSSDPTKYWDGTLNSTQYLVPDGVYYYIIKATCGGKNYDKKGFVQVLGGK